MSIELNVADWNAEEYDACCTTTVAELKINGIKIPLCLNSVEELKAQVEAFCKAQYCYQCQHFKMSKWGFKYDGSCNIDGNVTEENIGHINCVGSMYTCKKFLEKKD